MNSRVILQCVCLSATLLLLAACSEKSQLFCSATQQCEVGLPVCDLEGICAASDHIANTCILEARWDAGVASVDATESGSTDAALANQDAGADAFVQDCTQELACPMAANNTTTLCGSFENAADRKRLLGDGTSMLCDPMSPAMTGPCAIELQFFDALNYAATPGAATPIAAGTLSIDGCGRFVVQDIPTPPLGFLAVVAQDYAGQDSYVTTAGFVPVIAGASLRLDLTVLDHEGDERWTSTAGAPFGSATFSQVGTTMITFQTLAGPRAGVQLARGGAVAADDDYYFFDAVATNRFQVRPVQNATGANGTALIVNSASLVTHDGTGAEPDGCTWSGIPSETIAGVLIYATSIAEDGSGNPC